MAVLTKNNELIERDLAHVWHPCSQMKDYETFKPLVIKSAEGSYLKTADGKKIIDAISSWWCKSLGHGHPRLTLALINQMEKFEHVILANTTNSTVVKLAERLAKLTNTLKKVSFASDGSCAVEMAIKMAIHAQLLKGHSKRTELMALQHSYHGETCAALAVSDEGRFRKPYESLLPRAHFLQNIPYVSGKEDPLWDDCGEMWPAIEKQLNEHADTLALIIVEPILQGAGGMLFYSPDFLKRLRQWTQNNNVYLIADEILTGIGRVGKNLACEYADIEPDFLVLSKSLTSGWLPLSVMLTTDEIYQLFYNDYDPEKSFLHSHTHTGNALACAVALATLQVMHEENIANRVNWLETRMHELMQEVAQETGLLHNVRGLGAVMAADLTIKDYPRAGYAVYQKAVELGALLRPMGDTIYWLPPLNIEPETLDQLKAITVAAIKDVFVDYTQSVWK
jgi:adenosylmethionine---8-amino-7-oxononanoate aminotransferase